MKVVRSFLVTLTAYMFLSNLCCFHCTTCLVFICICTCLVMFISFYVHVCLNCRRRLVTKVMRTCGQIQLLYQRISSDKASNLPKRDVRFILLK